MSEHEFSYESVISVNGQEIKVATKVKRGFKNITYVLDSESQIATLTAALTLYLMCQSICDKLEIDIDDLSVGLQESPSEEVH